MQEFELWTTTQTFGEDADQSALLNRAVDVKSLSFWLICGLLMVLTAGLAVSAASLLLVGNWDLGLLFALMLATVAAMLAWALTGWSVRAEIKAGRKERQKNGAKDSQVTIRLTDKGCFCGLGPGAELSQVFAWEDIGKITESEDLFFLAGKKVPGICLRKSALTSGTEEELRVYLQSKQQRPIKKYEINLEKMQKLLK